MRHLSLSSVATLEDSSSEEKSQETAEDANLKHSEQRTASAIHIAAA